MVCCTSFMQYHEHENNNIKHIYFLCCSNIKAPLHHLHHTMLTFTIVATHIYTYNSANVKCTNATSACFTTLTICSCSISVKILGALLHVSCRNSVSVIGPILLRTTITPFCHKCLFDFV